MKSPLDLHVKFYLPKFICTPNATFQLPTILSNNYQPHNTKDNIREITFKEMNLLGRCYKKSLLYSLSVARLNPTVELAIFYDEAGDLPYLDLYFYLSRRHNNTPYQILYDAVSSRSIVSHVLTEITGELKIRKGSWDVMHHKKYGHTSEIKLRKGSDFSPEEKDTLSREFPNTTFYLIDSYNDTSRIESSNTSIKNLQLA